MWVEINIYVKVNDEIFIGNVTAAGTVTKLCMKTDNSMIVTLLLRGFNISVCIAAHMTSVLVFEVTPSFVGCARFTLCFYAQLFAVDFGTVQHLIVAYPLQVVAVDSNF